MQGGRVHSVPITIEKCGMAIAWEFNTEPKGIVFGIVLRNLKGGRGETYMCDGVVILV